MQPERIGRYRIINELGRGGFATVYLCEDRSLDDTVAVKLLAENQAVDPESVTRFVAEARVMRNLRTPGVVTVHDVGEQDGRPYFVMEYCDRGALSGRLATLGRPLTIDEGVGLATALSQAMSGLHSSVPPVVHRDIKPDNLLIRSTPGLEREPIGELLRSDEELIVGDFGLAKVVDLQATKLSLIAYTRGFAPPEQVRGLSGIQPSADVFSASAVLISAISGQSPEQVFADGEQAFPEQALAATGPLRQDLERGIQFDSSRRHATVMEWSDALTAAAVRAATPQQPTSVVPPPEPLPFDPRTSGNRPLDDQALAAFPAPAPSVTPEHSQNGSRRGIGIAAAGVALIGLIGLIGFALVNRGGPSIVGPEETRVGEEAAFAVIDAEVQEWQVGDDRIADSVLLFRPTGPGRVTVRAVTDDDELEFSVQVDEADQGLSIVGPGLLPLGETTVLSVEGADAAGLTWTVAGTEYELATLEVRPTEVGVFEAEVRSSDGVTVTRTFTVAPAIG